MKIEDLYEDDDRERVNFYIGLLILAVTAVVIALGIVKVKNELAMTKEYARWADASARQAAALERIDRVLAARLDPEPGSLVQAGQNWRAPLQKWVACAPGVLAKDEKGCAEYRQGRGSAR